MKDHSSYKLYIIAGEASGDLHGSNLIKALKANQKQVEIRAWGGEKMQEQGAEIVRNYRDLAFMGFVEVLLNLRTIINNLRFCKKDILSFRPDALVLIDYPGFNLRIAKFAHEQKIKVIYYISPQIWAWKKSRVYDIKKHVNKMLVILPFEKDFYNTFDYDVEYVGHPLIDAIDDYLSQKTENISVIDSKPLILLLPGSRRQEIERILPKMLEIIPSFKEYQFAIAGVSQHKELIEQIVQNSNHQLPVFYNKTYALFSKAKAALVASGTATLETALFGVPQVVCYAGGSLSVLIARYLIKVKYISLVNLIMDKEVVKELIQEDLNRLNLEKALRQILNEKRENLLSEYTELKEKLGGGGASENAAKAVLKTLST